MLEIEKDFTRFQNSNPALKRSYIGSAFLEGNLRLRKLWSDCRAQTFLEGVLTVEVDRKRFTTGPVRRLARMIESCNPPKVRLRTFSDSCPKLSR
jgi:hypothetical protein